MFDDLGGGFGDFGGDFGGVDTRISRHTCVVGSGGRGRSGWVQSGGV